MAPIWLWYHLLFGIRCTPCTLHHLHWSTFDLNCNVGNRCQVLLFSLQPTAAFRSVKCTGILYLVLHFNMHKQRIFIAASSNDTQWHCSAYSKCVCACVWVFRLCVQIFFYSSFGICPAVGSGMLSTHWWDDKLSLICSYLVGSIK